MIGGDIESADQHLRDAAAAVVPSPVQTTFGPDTELAAQLLAVGRRESVLSYLESFRKIWKRPLGGPTLDAWIRDVREGRPWPAKDVGS